MEGECEIGALQLRNRSTSGSQSCTSALHMKETWASGNCSAKWQFDLLCVVFFAVDTVSFFAAPQAAVVPCWQ